MFTVPAIRVGRLMFNSVIHSKYAFLSEPEVVPRVVENSKVWSAIENLQVRCNIHLAYTGLR